MNPQPLHVIIADDELPARERLRDLLADLAQQQPTILMGMAANGLEALRLLDSSTAPVDLILTDIRMPDMDGVALAKDLENRSDAPAVIFITAYDEYAVNAFELAATDYLLKPVRSARLAEALSRVRQRRQTAVAQAETDKMQDAFFTIHERAAKFVVPLKEVLFCRAEQKYVVIVTAKRSFLLDTPLVQIEQRYADYFVRVHRSCLVARDAIAGVKRDTRDASDARWEILLHGSRERLPVSRRQWSTLKNQLNL